MRPKRILDEASGPRPSHEHPVRAEISGYHGYPGAALMTDAADSTDGRKPNSWSTTSILFSLLTFF
uniref:Uncharacterized protein n=2 Tax=Anguilla anguilla TaxID=7936 RepID=A0A0E9SXL3_ANGAN